MYRICDLVEINTGEKLRRNVSENNAEIGLGVRFSDTKGSWKIVRTHGYSIFQD